ncbi:E3 ubiquitin-protein ligase TRIM71-like [Patella vulgata]|uniref:E3 ubiquitin-protein ligase TRIM71-like n=1 Tax=Patella vulgata TaxID=6465 RepID=UPI00217FD13A|nr:E3 ubiquitin-protein ligase TRIM71-like [Patella vulgata]
MAANIQDLLQCPICLCQLKQPRILPCFHSFCEKCLDTHIQISSQGSQSYFPCPSCRIITKTPNTHSKKFPRDFRLIKFMDVLKSVVGKNNKSLCDICSLEDKYENAVSFCSECRKHFCFDCERSHRSKSCLSSHMLLNVNREESANQTTRYCNSHQDEELRFMCHTCDLDLCVVCVIKDHTDHSVIGRDVQIQNNQRLIAATFQNLHHKIWKIHEDLFNLTCFEGRLKGRYAESKYQIQKQARKLMQRILGDEKKYLKELDETFLEKRTEVDELKNIFRTDLTQLEIFQSQLSCLLSSAELDAGHQDQLLERINSLETETTLENSPILQTFKRFVPGGLFQLGKFEEISLEQDTNHISNFALVSMSDTTTMANGETLLSRSQSLNILEDLNPIIVKTPHRLSDESGINDTADERAAMHDQSGTNKNKRFVQRYAVSVHPICTFGRQGDSSQQLCLPYNICFTNNDEIIVAENGNKRIQIFDKYGHSLKIIGQGDMIPRGVTLLNSKEIAITDELTKGVKIYNIKGELLRDFMPRCMTLPYGITSAQNGDFLFTDMVFETVSVIKQDGELRYQFGGHGCSDNYFDNPGNLIVDRRDRILVSDSSNHSIKVFTKHGHFLFKFGSYGTGPGKLRYPKGLAIDLYGNILVVDSGNDRVVMFSKEGSYMGIVLDKSHGLQRPTGLCLSKTNLLAVSMPDISEIRVFAISS